MAGLPKNFSDILLPDDLIWFDKCRVRGFEEMSRVSVDGVVTETEAGVTAWPGR